MTVHLLTSLANGCASVPYVLVDGQGALRGTGTRCEGIALPSEQANQVVEGNYSVVVSRAERPLVDDQGALVNQGANSVSVLDTRSGAVLGTIAVGFWPSVADNPDATPSQREIARRDNESDKVVISD